MLTRFDPFRELAALQTTLNRAMQTSAASDELMTSGNFIPPVDIYENENSLSLRFEVPGMKEDDLDIRLENSTLTVRGERNFEKEEKEENFHRIERRYGSFTRSFTLPNTVDTEKIKADYKDGILTVELGKRAEAKPKQIKVGVGTGAGKKIEMKEGKGQAA